MWDVCWGSQEFIITDYGILQNTRGTVSVQALWLLWLGRTGPAYHPVMDRT